MSNPHSTGFHAGRYYIKSVTTIKEQTAPKDKGIAGIMKISEILCPALIKTELESETKYELFEEMVDLFVKAGEITDREAAVRVLEEREARMSTGIASGLGLPHGRLPGLSHPLLALGISREGIEYDSLDGEPVYVVITIFAKEDEPMLHVQILAEISRLFSIPDFLRRLRQCRTTDDVLAVFRSEE